MDAQAFTWWLQGFLEVANPKTLNEAETAMIKEHLQLVFKKVTGSPKEEKGHPMDLVDRFIKRPGSGGTSEICAATAPIKYCTSVAQDPFSFVLLATGVKGPYPEGHNVGWYFDGSGWRNDSMVYPFGIVKNEQDKYKFNYNGGFPMPSC